MLAIGYAVYWLELYVLKASKGVTSPLAWVLFCLASVAVIWSRREKIAQSLEIIKSDLSRTDLWTKVFVSFGSLIVLLIFACTFYAALLPPHLSQETDALNYHLAISRQHLILNSFKLIPWCASDLFLLPLNFALAPYWFATVLPNKFPQLLFLAGLTWIAANLVRTFFVIASAKGGAEQSLYEGLLRPMSHPGPGPRNDVIDTKVPVVSLFLIVFAIFGSHNFGIQMGTAMLDLVICYLLLAAMDSLLAGQLGMAAVEFTFFIWSKSFIPVQMAVIALALVIAYSIFRKLGFAVLETKNIRPRRPDRWFISFALLSLLIGGPFMAKAVYYSGTPFFPIAPGSFMINKNIDTHSTYWQAVRESSDFLLGTGKDGYGHGRSFLAFFKHLWLIAIPEDEVNNAYDYPVGLVYLLFLGPFFHKFADSLRKKEFPVILLAIIAYWVTWWFGSQQTRFLYIPLVLMFISVIVWIKTPSRVLMGMILLALFINAVSITRAHKNDWGKSGEEVLRKKDLSIVWLSRNYIKEGRTDLVRLDEHELAYAQFPVIVTKKKVPFTLNAD